MARSKEGAEGERPCLREGEGAREGVAEGREEESVHRWWVVGGGIGAKDDFLLTTLHPPITSVLSLSYPNPYLYVLQT